MGRGRHTETSLHEGGEQQPKMRCDVPKATHSLAAVSGRSGTLFLAFTPCHFIIAHGNLSTD